MKKGFLLLAEKVRPGECVVVGRAQTVETRVISVEKFDGRGEEIGVTRAVVGNIVVQNGAREKTPEKSDAQAKPVDPQTREHLIEVVRKLRAIELKS
jgi:hypothetical protein